MSVISCNLDFGADGETCEADHNFVRKHTRRYIVLTDSKLDTAYGVLVGASITGPRPIPMIYTRHPSDIYSFARRAKCTRAEEPQKWFVTVEYDNQVDPARNVPNPLDRPPIVRMQFAQFQKPAPRDQDGNLITTSAGQPFVPALEIDDSRPVITIARNEAVFPAITAIDYQDAISTDIVYGADPGCAKMQNIDIGEERYENDVRFRTITYELHFDRDGWEKDVLNRGTEALDQPDGRLMNLGEIGPKLLDADGTLLNGTGTLWKPDGSRGKDATYSKPSTYKKLPFAPLNLEYSLLPIT